MGCRYCSNIENSHKEKPFVYGDSLFYVCEHCGQRWWCYNDYYSLWTTVDDHLTWENLKKGCPIPVEISTPAHVMPGYEEYAVKPQHEVCEKEVFSPTLFIESGEKGKTVVVQWIGEYTNRNIFSYQFKWPVLLDFESEEWGGHPESFRVVFLGKAEEYPEKNVRKQITNNSEETDKWVIQLVSSKVKCEYPTGPGPKSFIINIVLLGDPNVGIIQPQQHYNPQILGEEMERFEAKVS